MEETLISFKTQTDSDGCIGKRKLELLVLFKILWWMLANSLLNLNAKILGSKYRRHIYIWAIDDNNHNYSIYVDNCYKEIE